jgi:hypothetical protein
MAGIRVSRTAGIAAVAAVLLLALGVGSARAGARAFDSTATSNGAGAAPSVLLTAPFALGEVDLSTLGVDPAALSTAGLAGTSTASSPGDGPNMYIVDDDKAQCPNAPFSRIQDAVDASGPNDQIKVCPGTYNEQVVIGPKHDGLRLFSQVPLQAVIKMPVAETKLPRSIVTVHGSTDVSIWQFTISGPFYFPACAEAVDRHTGVRIYDGSATLFGNHITEIRNANPALFGCQDGIGVLVGRAFEQQVGVATLRNNLIDLYQKGAVVVDNEGSYGLITQNEIDGDLGLTPTIAQNGVQIGRGASADVDHNVIRNNFFARLGLDDTAAGVLLFETAAHVSVDHNDVANNGVGIDVDEGAVGLTVDHNDVTKSHNNGLAAYVGSQSNTISYNKATDNAPVDCYDETPPGGGTPPTTSNFWIKDMGVTENKSGLCRKATP